MSPTITDIEGRNLNDSDWSILSSVRDLLDAFRRAETSLKSNSCKNLSNAMWAYNNLMYELLQIKAQSPLLGEAVNCATPSLLKNNSRREEWDINLDSYDSYLAELFERNDSVAISMSQLVLNTLILYYWRSILVINPTIKMSKFPARSGIYWKNEFLGLVGYLFDMYRNILIWCSSLLMLLDVRRTRHCEFSLLESV